jgi:hypothetical protein
MSALAPALILCHFVVLENNILKFIHASFYYTKGPGNNECFIRLGLSFIILKYLQTFKVVSLLLWHIMVA